MGGGSRTHHAMSIPWLTLHAFVSFRLQLEDSGGENSYHIEYTTEPAHQISGSQRRQSSMSGTNTSKGGGGVGGGGGGGGVSDGDSSGKPLVDSEKRMRREIANSNERRRMQSINAGFQSLRSLLPRHEGEKLSKVRVLQFQNQIKNNISTLWWCLRLRLLSKVSYPPGLGKKPQRVFFGSIFLPDNSHHATSITLGQSPKPPDWSEPRLQGRPKKHMLTNCRQFSARATTTTLFLTHATWPKSFQL